MASSDDDFVDNGLQNLMVESALNVPLPVDGTMRLREHFVRKAYVRIDTILYAHSKAAKHDRYDPFRD